MINLKKHLVHFLFFCALIIGVGTYFLYSFFRILQPIEKYRFETNISRFESALSSLSHRDNTIKISDKKTVKSNTSSAKYITVTLSNDNRYIVRYEQVNDSKEMPIEVSLINIKKHNRYDTINGLKNSDDYKALEDFEKYFLNRIIIP
jgi:hypothetical protein